MVEAVTYILENHATVQGLVGGDASGEQHKIFPVVAFNDTTAPYVIVTQVGQVTGGKNCDYTYTIQMTSYAKSYDAVTALNLAVIDAVTGQASGSVNGQQFGFLNVVNSVDGFDKEQMLYAKVTTFEGMAE